MSVHRARIPAAFYGAACFLVLAPVSVSNLGTIGEVSKYLRLLVTMGIVLVGLGGRGRVVSGPAGSALAVFVVAFVGAGLYSSSPYWALFHKGMFLLTCFSGLVLAAAPRNADELRAGLLLLCRVAFFTAFLALFVYFKNPAAATKLDRLAVAGINANMIGQFSAPMVVICVYVFLNDRRRSSQMTAMAGMGALMLVVLATGSRGAALMAILGSAFVVYPRVKQVKVLLSIVALVAVSAAVASMTLDNDAVSRGLGMANEGHNRTNIWGYGLKLFLRSPIIGHGWLSFGGRQWGSVLNMYLQTLVEAGVVGGLVLCAFLVALAVRWLSQVGVLRRTRSSREYAFLAAGLLAGVLAHGLGDSGAVMGTTLNSLILGFGTGLTDRLHVFGGDAPGRYLVRNDRSASRLVTSGGGSSEWRPRRSPTPVVRGRRT